MILLARDALDGRPDQRTFGAIDITVRRNGYGRQRDSFETDLEVAGLDAPFHAVFIRAPVVERAGDAVEVDGYGRRPSRALPTGADHRSLRSIPSCRATAASTSASCRRSERMSGHSKWATIKHQKGAKDSGEGQAVREAHPPGRGRGTRGRRRSRGQPDAAHHVHEGASRVGADGHHRPRDQAGHGRARGRRLRVGELRGLRARRRRGARRGADRQPQPHRARTSATSSRRAAGRWPSPARCRGSSRARGWSSPPDPRARTT